MSLFTTRLVSADSRRRQHRGQGNKSVAALYADGVLQRIRMVATLIRYGFHANVLNHANPRSECL